MKSREPRIAQEVANAPASAGSGGDSGRGGLHESLQPEFPPRLGGRLVRSKRTLRGSRWRWQINFPSRCACLMAPTRKSDPTTSTTSSGELALAGFLKRAGGRNFNMQPGPAGNPARPGSLPASRRAGAQGASNRLPPPAGKGWRKSPEWLYRAWRRKPGAPGARKALRE